MSDRKYRQRGYQDEEPRERKPQKPREAPSAGPPGRVMQRAEGPKTPNLMAAHEVVKCSRCGNRIVSAIDPESRCSRCGSDLHACAQCTYFDPGRRFECMQPISARVAPKDARNACTFYAPRTTIERQTGSTAPNSARKAFDDLFR
ncbi:MAG: hypothetical protein ACE148_13540 [Vicinamibacterales bacterium]